MRVSTYAKNNGISLQDVLESLKSQFVGVWTSTSKLTPDDIEYLNSVFSILEKTQPALPPSTKQSEPQPQPRIPTSLRNDVIPPSTKQSEPQPQPQQEAIVPKQPSGLDLTTLQAKLSPEELAIVQRLVDTENITTSAQIEAINHHDLYEDIYSNTRRTLGTRKLTNSLAERERLQNLYKERVQARKTTLETQLEEHEQVVNSAKTWLENFKLENQISI